MVAPTIRVAGRTLTPPQAAVLRARSSSQASYADLHGGRASTKAARDEGWHRLIAMATDTDFGLLRNEIFNVFTPAAPIVTREFFSGRIDQLQAIAETISERGRHAIVYGERGVGKTSMANILGELFPDRLVVRVAADSSDTYASLWRKVFRRVSLTSTRRGAGFGSDEETTAMTLADAIGDATDPDTIALTLSEVAPDFVAVIDEFDRLTDSIARQLVADTIKTFSDSASAATIVVVGVAHDVRDLIGDHPSIERNLRQIPMPRMSRDELRQILDKGYGQLAMDLPGEIRERMVVLSQGFPHYTHLLGKYTALEAVGLKQTRVTRDDFELAIEGAIEDTQESIRAAYHRAIMTTRPESMFPAVLLAAALAPQDEYGTFRATDLIEPLGQITGKTTYKVENFVYNLGKLSAPERGDVLERVGDKRPRYRFSNPLMKPFILMKGFQDGLIDEESLISSALADAPQG
jgi:hypothetical protein